MSNITRLRSGGSIVYMNGVARLVMYDGTDDEIIERFHQMANRTPQPEEPPARVLPASKAAADSPAVNARRQKMIAIGQESVASRNRVFPQFPHVPASRKNQAYDGLLALLYRKRIKEDDKILVRHLKTGEYDEMTVGELLDELGNMTLFQLELRKHDQSYREKVNTIFKDETLSEEEKAKRINAFEVPDYLEVDGDGRIK